MNLLVLDFIIGALLLQKQGPIRNLMGNLVMWVAGETVALIYMLMIHGWMFLVCLSWVVNHGLPFSVKADVETPRKRKKSGSELVSPKRKRS